MIAVFVKHWPTRARPPPSVGREVKPPNSRRGDLTFFFFLLFPSLFKSERIPIAHPSSNQVRPRHLSEWLINYRNNPGCMRGQRPQEPDWGWLWRPFWVFDNPRADLQVSTNSLSHAHAQSRSKAPPLLPLQKKVYGQLSGLRSKYNWLCGGEMFRAIENSRD